jgi:hypothetical protein
MDVLTTISESNGPWIQWAELDWLFSLSDYYIQEIEFARTAFICVSFAELQHRLSSMLGRSKVSFFEAIGAPNTASKQCLNYLIQFSVYTLHVEHLVASARLSAIRLFSRTSSHDFSLSEVLGYYAHAALRASAWWFTDSSNMDPEAGALRICLESCANLNKAWVIHGG